MTRTARKHVVVVGGGFAGLRAARALSSEDLEVTLVDRRNHHLFQPLLYQVACAGLSPDAIAVPLRRILRRSPNTQVLMDTVQDVDRRRRRVELCSGGSLDYDYLILAAGAEPNYFGNEQWKPHAPSLKSLESALDFRERILKAMERAELEPDAAARQRLLSFAVVGAGPTGVELAGALAELGRIAVPDEYRRLDPSTVSVTLVEMADRVLPGYAEPTSCAAANMLRELGVELRLQTRVTDIGPERIECEGAEIDNHAACWASGVKPVGLAATVDAERDDGGRVVVAPDCSLPDDPCVFVVGDMACHRGERGDRDPLPALAAVAVQQGDHVAGCIAADVRGRTRTPFAYSDLGVLATIGRGRAVADIGRMHLAGTTAWWLWSIVHLYQLLGLRNRVQVLIDWAWQYLTPGRRAGARIIMGAPPEPPPSKPTRLSPPDNGRGSRDLHTRVLGKAGNAE